MLVGQDNVLRIHILKRHRKVPQRVSDIHCLRQVVQVLDIDLFLFKAAFRDTRYSSRQKKQENQQYTQSSFHGVSSFSRSCSTHTR